MNEKQYVKRQQALLLKTKKRIVQRTQRRRFAKIKTLYMVRRRKLEAMARSQERGR